MGNPLAGYIVFWLLHAFWAVGAIAASSVHMLTRGQMLLHGIKKGMPYFWHAGMWNDVVTIHPVCALMVSLCWAQWRQSIWSIPFAMLALAVSYFANKDWVKDTSIVQSHAELAPDKVHSTGEMSIVAWVHIPHMAIILTIIFMSAVSIINGKVPSQLATSFVCLLVAHALIGQHGILRVLNPVGNPWPRQPFDEVALALSAVFWVVGLVLMIHFFVDKTV